MIISGANTYGVLATNSTFLTAGTLLVNNTSGSGTGVGDVLVTGGTLGGIGTISGGVSNISATISPGASVGQLNTGSEYWSNTTLRVEINDATGADGVGHDFLNITGALSLDQTQTVIVATLNGSVAGDAANFSSSNSGGYSWKIISASGGITGFDANKIVISSVGFSNAKDGGVFSISNVGNDIFLNFRNAAHIVSNPANETTAPTATTVFSVVAAGETPIAYTWKYNGVNIANGPQVNGTIVSGADTAFLTLANVSSSDFASGSLFNVAVTNTVGGAESATATLTIVDPAISIQPVAVTIGAGSNAVYSVTAEGSPTLTYQWNKGGFPITPDTHFTGVNSATMTIVNVSDADEDSYSVTVSNGGANSPALSSSVALTVVNPPVILTDPASITNTGGTTANFTVTASGDTLKYQWRKNGSNISGKTTSALALPNVQLADAANYDVVITNFANKATSSVAVLSLQFTLSATSSSPFGSVAKSPSKALYDANENVQLTATALNPSFAFSSWSGGATGSVNPLNIAMTTNTTITANFTSSIPDIIIDEDNAFNSGGNTSISNGAWSAATGGGNSGFFRFATGVGGQLGTPDASWKFTPNILTSGNYDVYVTYTASAAGGNRATNAPVRIYPNGPTIENRFNEEANGNTFQLVGNAYFMAGTSGYVSVDNDITTSPGGDICIADAIKLVYSTSVQKLTSNPTNKVANYGSTATFSVTPTFAGSYSYQWQKGTVDIGGETAASLVLNNVANADEGNYRVVVTDGVTTNTTAAATLTVIDPIINTPPADLIVGDGTNATFSVVASGTTLAYQWNKGGVPIPGATESFLSLTPAKHSDAATN
jgi:hypothetical protein